MTEPYPMNDWIQAQVELLALVSSAKVRALTEKEQDPISQDGDIWEDFDEAGNIKSLKFWLVEEVSPPTGAVASPPMVVLSFAPPYVEINPVLPQKTLISSPEDIAYKTMLILLSTHPNTLFASRPINRLMSQQVLQGEA